jgi:prepilin-type N-terminal cleavage/methylation domain-containing protein
MNYRLYNQKGFTMIEMILYIAIVSVLLVGITYLFLDVLQSQKKDTAGKEVNDNVRFISAQLMRDIRSAESIGSVSPSALTLVMPGDDVIYIFDQSSEMLIRQIGSAAPVQVHSDSVSISGSFDDLSYLTRSANISVTLIVSYRSPDNLPEYNASSTIQFSTELRGRR